MTNDWVAINLFNPDSSMEEVVLHGVTGENTSMNSADYYKQLEPVKQKFTENGKFNEDKFNEFYNSCLTTYNNLCDTNWEDAIIKNMPKDALDWMDPLNANIKDVTVTVLNGSHNPERRSMSLTGIGSIGDAQFSIRELAQDNYVRDEQGNKLDWTPNSMNPFKSLVAPTLALATYDEDGFHEENGQRVAHKKGDYKTDSNGDFYYEILGNRPGHDKEILRWTDTLTKDGTTLNKFDILDQDGLTTEAYKTILNIGLKTIPLLTPIGKVWGTIGVVADLARSLPVLAKSINSIVEGVTGINNESFDNKLDSAINYFGRFKETQSDKSSQKLFTLESIGNIITSSARQLYSQRMLGNFTGLLTKGISNGAQATRLNQMLSLGYLSLTSSDQIYSDFKQAGATDAVAGIGMLASTAALFGLMDTEYFRRWLFKGTFMDDSEAVDVLSNFVRNDLTSVHNIAEIPTPEQSKRLFTRIFNKTKDFFADPKYSWIIGNAPRTASTELSAARQTVNSTVRTLKSITSRAINEGVEETMEEVSSDAVKAVFSGLDALGIKVHENDVKELDFGESIESVLKRYLTTFVGGALGGATFAGIEHFNKLIGPEVVDLMDLDAKHQLIYLLTTGRESELLDRLEVLKKRGLLGNILLSAKETIVKKDKDGVEKTLYAKGTSADNQNLANYEIIKNTINYYKNLLSSEGLMQLTMRFDQGVPALNSKYKKNLEHQNEVAQEEEISSASEYLERKKTNAVIDTITDYKLHTTYVNDVVELGREIVDTRSKLQRILSSAISGDTSEEQKIAALSTEKRKDYEYLKKHLDDLHKQRDELINKRNDDIYMHQTMFVTNPDLSESFIGGVGAGTEFDKSSFWASSVENYAKIKTGRSFNAMSEEEQKVIKKEYNDFKNTTGVDRLISGSKLHYQLIQDYDSKLKELENEFKDYSLDNYYDHGSLQGTSSAFQQFTELGVEIMQLKAEYNDLEVKVQEYKTKKNVSEEELVNDSEYQELLKELNELSELHNKKIKEQAQFYQAYGKNGWQELQFSEELTEEGFLNLYSKYSELLAQQTQLLKVINAQTEINKINSKNSELQELLDNTPDFTDEEKLDFKTQIAEGYNNKKRLLTNIGITAEGDTNLINEQIKTKLEELQTSYKTVAEELMESVKQYYRKLISEKLVSGNDIVFKQAISAITLFRENLMNLFGLNTSDIIFGTLQTFDDTINEYDEVKDQIQNLEVKISDFFKHARSGEISETLDVLESIKTYVSEQFSDIDAEKFTKTLVTELLDGVDLQTWMNDVQKLKSQTKTFSAIDFVRSFDIDIDDSTKNVMQIMDDEEMQFHKSKTVDEYLIKNPIHRKALRQVPALINTFRSIIECAFTDVNKMINKYRTVAGKSKLAEDLSSSTREIIDSDFSYLWQFAGRLLEIDEMNIAREKGMQQDSAIKLSSNFIRTLFFAHENEGSIAAKIKSGKFVSLDLEELWKATSGPEYNNVTRDNYKDFTKRVHQFEQAIFNKIQEIKTQGINNKEFESEKSFYEELGNHFATLFDAEAYKMISDKSTNIEVEQTSNYTTVMRLCAIASINSNDVYSRLKSFYTQNESLIPLIGQIWNIHFGVALIENPTIFNAALTGVSRSGENYAASLNEQDKIDYLTSKPILQNLLFVQGGAGSGKTSVVAKAIMLIEQSLHENDTEFALIAPDESQVQNLTINLGEQHKHLTLKDALSLIVKDYENAIHNSEGTSHGQVFDGTIETDANVVFDKNTSKKIMFLDEATFCKEGDLQILTQWAQKNNITIIAMGDRKQNGYISENGITSGFEDCYFAQGIELTDAIRAESIAQLQNLMSVSTPINRILEWYRENPTARVDEVNDKVKELCAGESGRIKLGYYYEVGKTFVGTKFIQNSDVDGLLTDFINLSKNLRANREDAQKEPSVCIIVDEDKVKNYIGWQDKGVVIRTPRQAQGGEWDYVLVDATLTNGDNLYQLRNLYTLMSRARHGSAFVGNPSQFKFVQINVGEPDNSITNEPTSFVDNADEIKNWFMQSFEDVSEEKIDSGSPTPTDDASTDNTPKTKPTNDEVEKEGLGTETKADDVDAKSAAKVATIESGSVVVEQSKEAVLKETKDKLDKVKQKRDKSRNSKATTVKEDLIAYLNSHKSVDELRSLMPNVDWNNLSSIDLAIKSLEKFASAFYFGIDEIISSDSVYIAGGLEESFVQQLITLYNETKNKTFSAKSISDNQSVIYWDVLIDGKKHSIPIAVIKGQYNGTVNAEKLFKLKWVSSKTTAKHMLSLDEIFTTGHLYGKNKIFAPAKNHRLSGNSNDDFVKHSNGLTFTVWSECDTTTDEEIDEIFKHRWNEQTREYDLYIDAEMIHTGTGTNKEVAYKLRSGAIVHLISIHRVSDLASLYNATSILRFYNGFCEYSALSSYQKGLISGYSDYKTGAKIYLMSIFGDLSGLNPMAAGENNAESREALKQNMELLRTKYQLISPGSIKFLIGGLWNTFASLEQSNPEWFKKFKYNLGAYLFRDTYTSKTTGNSIQNGLRVEIKNANYKEGSEVESEKYRTINYTLRWRKETSTNSHPKAFLDVYLGNQFDKGPLTSIQVTSEVDLNNIITELNALNTTNDGSKYEFNKDNLNNGNIVFKFCTINNDKDSGQWFVHEVSAAFNYIFTLLNEISNLDFSQLESAFRANSKFVDGLYYNDFGIQYKVGNTDKRDVTKTAWKEQLQTNLGDRKSDICEVTSSVFVLNDDIEFSTENPKVESTQEPEILPEELYSDVGTTWNYNADTELYDAETTPGKELAVNGVWLQNRIDFTIFAFDPDEMYIIRSVSADKKQIVIEGLDNIFTLSDPLPIKTENFVKNTTNISIDSFNNFVSYLNWFPDSIDTSKFPKEIDSNEKLADWINQELKQRNELEHKIRWNEQTSKFEVIKIKLAPKDHIINKFEKEGIESSNLIISNSINGNDKGGWLVKNGANLYFIDENYRNVIELDISNLRSEYQEILLGNNSTDGDWYGEFYGESLVDDDPEVEKIKQIIDSQSSEQTDDC